LPASPTAPTDQGLRLFLARYEALRSFYLSRVWAHTDEAQMRRRPDSRLNSIVWNLWHLNRAEDAGINRFVADRPQVLDEGDWTTKMKVPHRHNGTGMTLDEVDALSRTIELGALRGYSEAVSLRTLAVIPTIDSATLDGTLDETKVRRVLLEEGVAGPNAAWLVDSFTGWTKGQCLMHFGLTHGYQHVGEMGVLAALLDVDVYQV
jgi:hypothetical protein